MRGSHLRAEGGRVLLRLVVPLVLGQAAGPQLLVQKLLRVKVGVQGADLQHRERGAVTPFFA